MLSSASMTPTASFNPVLNAATYWVAFTAVPPVLRMVAGEPLARPSRHRTVEWSLACSRLACRIAAPSQKPDLPRDDFRAVPLAAAVLRFVLAGRQPSLDIDLAAFTEKLPARLGELPESHDAVPFGPLLLPAIAVGKPLGRRQREIRHALTRRKTPHLRGRTQIADYRYTIHCHSPSSCARFPSSGRALVPFALRPK
jgi:hypothetical protein